MWKPHYIFSSSSLSFSLSPFTRSSWVCSVCLAFSSLLRADGRCITAEKDSNLHSASSSLQQQTLQGESTAVKLLTIYWHSVCRAHKTFTQGWIIHICQRGIKKTCRVLAVQSNLIHLQWLGVWQREVLYTMENGSSVWAKWLYKATKDCLGSG